MTTKKYQLLFVDDTPEFRDFHREELQNAGFEITEADNEQTACDLFEKKRFDIAIIDLIMDHPDSGFTLAYRIRKKYPGMPVILVSSANSKFGVEFSADSESARVWMKCDDILAKPVRSEQLVSKAHRLLGIEMEQNHH